MTWYCFSPSEKSGRVLDEATPNPLWISFSWSVYIHIFLIFFDWGFVSCLFKAPVLPFPGSDSILLIVDKPLSLSKRSCAYIVCPLSLSFRRLCLYSHGQCFFLHARPRVSCSLMLVLSRTFCCYFVPTSILNILTVVAAEGFLAAPFDHHVLSSNVPSCWL